MEGGKSVFVEKKGTVVLLVICNLLMRSNSPQRFQHDNVNGLKSL